MNSKHSFFTLLFTLLTLAVTGCNTMHGVGQDVERAGEKIQQKSR